MSHASQTPLEHKPPESNKSVQRLLSQSAICGAREIATSSGIALQEAMIITGMVMKATASTRIESMNENMSVTAIESTMSADMLQGPKPT
jgi:hypothetical protein